ncbi:hypothetical protein TNCV_123901 [Trichonephila clavipes]|nr:hypothetical protein TNCV_123901 [Trichonephila clavipes]
MYDVVGRALRYKSPVCCSAISRSTVAVNGPLSQERFAMLRTDTEVHSESADCVWMVDNETVSAMEACRMR